GRQRGRRRRVGRRVTGSDGLGLIVGLGNPGADYARTRHNAGSWFIDSVADALGVRFSVDAKVFGETAQASVGGRTVRLLKPATFMNLSGKSRSEEHTSELQSREKLVCRLLLEKKKR